MLNAFGSIEALEEVIEPSADELNMEDVLFEMLDADAEVAVAAAELKEMDEMYAKAEDAIQEMQAIAGSIEEFGISAAVMKTVDPHRVLVAKGVVADYDSLEITPVKDSNATAAMEGFVDTVKKMWKKLIDFFKKMGSKIAEFFRKAFRGMKSHEAAILAMLKKLQKADIDESKFGDTKVKAYSLKDVDKIRDALDEVAMVIVDLGKIGAAVKAGNVKGSKLDDAAVKALKKKIADALKSIDGNDDMRKIGLEVKIKDDEVISLVRGKLGYTQKSDDLKSHKYSSVSVIEKGLKEMFPRIKGIKVSQKSLESSDKAYAEEAKTLVDESKLIDGDDAATAKLRNEASRARKNAMSYVKTMAQFGMTLESILVSNWLKVAKAALSAKADK